MVATFANSINVRSPRIRPRRYQHGFLDLLDNQKKQTARSDPPFFHLDPRGGFRHFDVWQEITVEEGGSFLPSWPSEPFGTFDPPQPLRYLMGKTQNVSRIFPHTYEKTSIDPFH